MTVAQQPQSQPQPPKFFKTVEEETEHRLKAKNHIYLIFAASGADQMPEESLQQRAIAAEKRYHDRSKTREEYDSVFQLKAPSAEPAQACPEMQQQQTQPQPKSRKQPQPQPRRESSSSSSSSSSQPLSQQQQRDERIEISFETGTLDQALANVKTVALKLLGNAHDEGKREIESIKSKCQDELRQAQEQAAKEKEALQKRCDKLQQDLQESEKAKATVEMNFDHYKQENNKKIEDLQRKLKRRADEAESCSKKLNAMKMLYSENKRAREEMENKIATVLGVAAGEN